ncbi:serine O-acetyltransferase [Arsenicicoccus sp. UBA7492]|uniref:serine O-acetyltransferase n=1 Tax=Arsenicicoccus sp. UBA7492 TaxID=1946057 RepID=UPI0039C87F7D
MKHDLADKDLSGAAEAFRRLCASDRKVNDQPGSILTLAVWRAGQVLSGVPGVRAFVLRRLCQLADGLWVRGVIGAELPPQVVAGPSLCLAHAGRGVVLHPETRIGADVKIYHQVTVGVRDANGAPEIGDRAMLGAGSKILGPIVLGDGTQVGANAVLLTSTEPDSSYVGIPARRVAGGKGEAKW